MIETASLIIARNPSDPEIFWVRRADHDRFLSGFHAFPGGRVDSTDAAGQSTPEAALRVAALRETLEETGWLPGVGRVEPSIRAAARAGELELATLLESLGATLAIDALQPIGLFRAPPYLVTAFRTHMFLLWADEADPRVDAGDPELAEGAWIRPADALAAWHAGEVLLAPPTRLLIEAMADGALADPARFAAITEGDGEGYAADSAIRPHLTLFPVRTPTLPPATHTNCYIIGHDELLVVEPASPEPTERARLDAWLDARIAAGAKVRGIALTHHHHDHIGGVRHLAERLGVPVMAHPITAELVPFPVDELLVEGDVVELAGGITLDVVHTPGHASGHICFIDRHTRDVVVGDMVAGVGSILVVPGDGDMRLYLDSLRRLIEQRPATLLPSHGPAIGGARHKLEAYIAHRLDRERQVLDALAVGAADLRTLVDRVYTDVPAFAKAGPAGGMAGMSLRAHLDALVAEGRAHHADGQWALG